MLNDNSTASTWKFGTASSDAVGDIGLLRQAGAVTSFFSDWHNRYKTKLEELEKSMYPEQAQNRAQMWVLEELKSKYSIEDLASLITYEIALPRYGRPVKDSDDKPSPAPEKRPKIQEKPKEEPQVSNPTSSPATPSAAPISPAPGTATAVPQDKTSELRKVFSPGINLNEALGMLEPISGYLKDALKAEFDGILAKARTEKGQFMPGANLVSRLFSTSGDKESLISSIAKSLSADPATPPDAKKQLIRAIEYFADTSLYKSMINPQKAQLLSILEAKPNGISNA